jgi:Transcriptional regulator, AbiEi antitoxin
MEGLGPGRRVWHETSDMSTFRAGPPRDLEIGELAARQHGVVSLRQLQLAGLSASAVRDRHRAGRLYRVHRGVYAVGHERLTGQGRVMAAVLAYGPGTVASHRAAAWLHALRPDNRARVDVIVPAASVRGRPSVDIHSSTTLRRVDVTTVDGIPCTSVPRTVLDLADVVPRRQVERAVEQSIVLRVFDLVAFVDVLANANGRRGAAVLRNVLAELADEPGITASEAEEAFLALCGDAGLPQPAVNQWLKVDDGPPLRADFLWRPQRLIVEVDSWRFHGTRAGFEGDRLRDQRARLAGWETVRFTRRQIEREGAWVASTVAALLAR